MLVKRYDPLVILLVSVIQGGALSRTVTLQWAAREELLSHWNSIEFNGIPPFSKACKTLRFLDI